MNAEPMTVRKLDAGEWPALSKEFRDLTFEQTRSYSEAAAARVGGHARFVAIERGSDIVALAALRIRNLSGFRKGVVWLPAGPLLVPSSGPDPDAASIGEVLTALRMQLVEKEHNILRLRFPALAFHDLATLTRLARSMGYIDSARAPFYQSYAVDLSLSEDELISRQKYMWHRNLRAALKLKMRVSRSAGTDLMERFQIIFDSVKERKGFNPTISPRFHLDCRGEDYAVETFIVTQDGQDVAAGLLGISHHNSTYLFGGTTEVGRQLRAGYQLNWSMIQRSAELGLTWFDFGGVDFKNNPDVAGYKERIGGSFIEGVGPFEATPRGLFPLFVTKLEDIRDWFKSLG